MQNFWNIGKEEYPFGTKPDYNSTTTNTTFNAGYIGNVQYQCGAVELPRVDILYGTNMLEATIDCDFSYQNSAPIYYYHPDHLGSTSWVTDESGNEQQFLAYLPYGEPLMDVHLKTYDGRHGHDDIRYKFTGKERDAETGYDYMEQRYYYPPLSIWLRPDPLLDKYIQSSPYAYCNGNPLKYVDPEGTKLRFAKGVSNDFKSSFAAAVQFMNRQKTSWILYRLEKRPEIIYLAPIEKRSHFSSKKKTIFWDPQVGIITYEGVILSPATVLNHEADHALQELENPEQKEIDKGTEDSQYGNAEEKRVITGSEQITARRHDEISDNEVTRTDHEGQYYETISPISTTGKNEVVIYGDKL